MLSNCYYTVLTQRHDIGVCIMYAGTESVKAQHGRIGSGVATPAGAQMADGSTPTDAGHAGTSKGGVFTTACMYVQPRLLPVLT